ncbi:LD-carboxypeptidase [Rhodocytophaga rosea]|uniref:LD-carboxypeptidase n=1 Tax=Rhodocytophaga rosea TaxID=2704465 RepID=A0A6C0GUP5_9BACT|nr:LD-carboxypeptidase [Rhodocytophaga rosea]
MIRPFFLQAGDTVGVVAPGGKVSSPDIDRAIQVIEGWGLKVQLGKHVFAENFQFAGIDEQRITDFQQMLDDTHIKAILCARGGYGTTRIIDRIDFSSFLKQPKWIVGYSDITALHCHLHSRGVQSIHAIMPLTFGKEETADSVESLRKVLFGENVDYQAREYPLNRTGESIGEIIGGNLALLASVTGTPSDIDTTSKILFIEDINEYLYNIDRMMIQLKRSGKLAHLAGLIVGHFSDVKDNQTPFGKTAYEIVAEAVQEYDYPVCYQFPIGHEPQNMAIPCGSLARLIVSNTGSFLTFDEEMSV